MIRVPCVCLSDDATNSLPLIAASACPGAVCVDLLEYIGQSYGFEGRYIGKLFTVLACGDNGKSYARKYRCFWTWTAAVRTRLLPLAIRWPLEDCCWCSC